MASFSGEAAALRVERSRATFPTRTLTYLLDGGEGRTRLREKLEQRLERDPETPSMLRPSRPIPTLGRTITISNSLPMEVGCRYGGRYWGGA